MKNKRGFTLIELLVVIAIIAILAAILFPVFLRAKAAAQASHCQSNMNQIGKAMKMYLSDWEDTYPTNRLTGAYSGIVAVTVPLSNPTATTSSGDPVRFQYGVNWVEGLYPYVEKVSEGDAASAWKCPAARSRQLSGVNSQVTYSFNINLIEMPEGAVKNAGNVMVSRELDGLYGSVLRPTAATATSSSAPSDPFLDSAEVGITSGTVKSKMHGDGSHILFADGHVKSFPIAYFPVTCQWDTVSQQWYNFAAGTSDPRDKSIAITP